MPQEPKSFFQRLTGARLVPSGDTEESYSPDDLSGESVPIENDSFTHESLEEQEPETEQVYSDEATVSDSEEQEGQLTVDVFQDDQNIVIQSTVAGVSPDDLDVSITNDMVTVRGERRRMYDIDPQDYFYQECYWGTFSRSIILPVEIDADRAEAKIKNGILTIRIPKANAAMTRKLKVKAV